MMFNFKSSQKTGSAKSSILSNFSIKSRYAESYRTLRTNVHFSLMEKELQSLVVTSAVSGEGKSNTVANLAFTIAQTGKRVLMIDSDLRKPGLSEQFSAKGAVGFADLISDLLGRYLHKGKIGEYGLADLITLISLQNRTCIATITDAENEVDLYFLKGEFIDIYWKNRPDGKKLASTLVRENLLTKEGANMALAHQQKSARRLGATLLTLGLVAEVDLNKILSLHVMEALRIAQEIKTGEFKILTVGEEKIKPIIGENGTFQQLLMEIMDTDDGSSLIQKEIDSAIIATDEKDLFLLPAGHIPPNPSELLGSNRTTYLIKQVQQKFDVIILDTSPVMPASDALLLGRKVDGVLLVVKAGKTNKNSVKDTVQQLQNAKAKILGVLLNQADLKQDNYYKYYQSYYGD